MIWFIFLLALLIRFLFFPNNIYFGFDQARDAFATLEIVHGNLKLIGPPTSFEGLFHGVFYYYLIAPIYFLSQGNPEIVAAFLRILNALGVFLVFYLGEILFNKRVGIITAILFAFSFEETQFAIYMGNPAPAVLSIGLMYLGLSLVIFKNKFWGLPLALFCLGLSIQLEFGLFYLVVPLALILIVYWKAFLNWQLKYYLLSIVAFVISVSSFLLAELKYGFKTFHSLIALATSGNSKDIGNILQTYLFSISRILTFNLNGNLNIGILVGVILLVSLVWFIRKKEYRKQLIFLTIWFFSLVITDIISGGVKDLTVTTPLFYTNIGVSLSLIIFVAFLLSKIGKVGFIIIIAILITNLSMVLGLNPKGTISEIDVQQEMLLADEKKVLDYIYQDSAGKQFAVKAVTMPFTINTTWSYLFDYYGKSKYGFIPVWNGKNAIGFPGNLEIEEAQENLPSNRYLIIEPTRGIAPYLINSYIQEEDYFTKIISEKNIGAFVVQKRQKF